MNSVPHPPLGATQLVGQSIRAFLGNFLPLMLVTFVPLMIVAVFSNLLLGDFFLALATASTSADPLSIFTGNYFAFLFGSSVVSILVISLAVLVAADVLQGEINGIGAYIGMALRSFFPIVILAVLAYVAIVFGMFFLIVPGVYLAAMWSLFLPAVLVEGRGFGALGRSMELTKGYRWPTLGANLMIWIAVIAISLPYSFLQQSYPIFAYTSLIGGLVGALLSSLGGAIVYGISGVFIVLLHGRLRELKEGRGLRTSADIFS